MIKQKTVIRILSLALAALLVTGGLALRANAQTEQYKTALENDSRRAFTGFVVAVRELADTLEKSRYCSGKLMTNTLCIDLYGKASAATAAMDQLPGAEQGLDKTYTFLSRVGDYACSLMKLDALEQEQTENLCALYTAARRLADTLESLQVDVDSGAVSVSALRQAERELPQLTDSIRSFEEEFPQVPRLIYDGPFSEHLTEQTPKLLEGKGELDMQQAKLVAADAVYTDTAHVRFEWERDGTVESYTYSCIVNAGDKYVTVTKHGGFLLSVLATRPVNRTNIDDEDAIQIARQYLSDQGFRDLTASYSLRHDNLLTVNFVCTVGSVLCYPDLIKVTVALDNGEIAGFDALGYVMSHTVRTLDAPTVPEQEAVQAVPAELTVTGTRLALIPTEGKEEKLCYEFACEDDSGRRYLIYVNSFTGQQEDILILIEDENGTLTV